jgi:hypothetical protein
VSNRVSKIGLAARIQAIADRLTAFAQLSERVHFAATNHVLIPSRHGFPMPNVEGNRRAAPMLAKKKA